MDAPGPTEIDTLLAGVPGITAAHLVVGEQVALVDTGARTSAPVVESALRAAGVGPGDLDWIVLTHVHLDHCGGTGLLARAFPRARVLVHPRGARHIVSPDRLVAAAAAVYGELAPVYGGLDAVEESRVEIAEDGRRVRIGPGRDLVVVETPGHARHHISLLDDATGTILAGDALGVRFAPSALYPAVPPPEFDPVSAVSSLGRLAGLGAERLCVSHYGPVPDVSEALALAADQQARAGEAARASWRSAPGDLVALETAVSAAVPPGDALASPGSRMRWLMMRWLDANLLGLAGWAEREEGPGPRPD